MAQISEIAPDLFRISWFWPEINLQFSHFLLRDEEPLLFTTGYRRTFNDVRDALAKVLDPARLRWISYSHFESDECGAMNQWLAIAPHATPVSGLTSAMVNLSDFADRAPRPLMDGDVLTTGKYRLRFCHTPHLPHGWDAGLLFEETQRTLLCSDLFHQVGDVEPVTTADIVGRAREAMTMMNAGPMPRYVPWCPYTGDLLRRLAALNPSTLAVMHGSSFTGNCAHAIDDLGIVMKELLCDAETKAAGTAGITAA